MTAVLLAAACALAEPDARACQPGPNDELVAKVNRVAFANRFTIYGGSFDHDGLLTRRFFIRTGAMSPGNRWVVEAKREFGLPVRTVVTLASDTWAPVDLGQVLNLGWRFTVTFSPADATTAGEFVGTTSASTRLGGIGNLDPCIGCAEVYAVASGLGNVLIAFERAGISEFRAPATCGRLNSVVGNAYESPFDSSYVTLQPGESATQQFAIAPGSANLELKQFGLYLGASTATTVTWKVERGDGHSATGTFAPAAGTNTIILRFPMLIPSRVGGFRLSLTPLDGELKWNVRRVVATDPCDVAARASIGGSLSYAEYAGAGHPAEDFAVGVGSTCSGSERTHAFPDVDGDGFGSYWPIGLIPVAAAERLSSNPFDCNDADPHQFPGAVELCDGKPNTCPAQSKGDGPMSPSTCPLTQGVCAAASQPCVNGKLEACTRASYGPQYEPVEIQCDGLDNDCDGKVDEWVLCPNQTGVCRGAVSECVNDARQVCGSQTNGPDYQLVETRCDGLDNDCDGEVDEGCPPPVVEDSPVCGCSSAGPGSLASALLALAALRRRRA